MRGMQNCTIGFRSAHPSMTEEFDEMFIVQRSSGVCFESGFWVNESSLI